MCVDPHGNEVLPNCSKTPSSTQCKPSAAPRLDVGYFLGIGGKFAGFSERLAQCRPPQSVRVPLVVRPRELACRSPPSGRRSEQRPV